MALKRWSCTQLIFDKLWYTSGLIVLRSTITYDTLVRAGALCTSAYVPAQDTTGTTNPTNPPFAKGSRGIKIVPDTYFSPQETTSVSVSSYLPL